MGTPGAPNQIVYWRELCKSVLHYVEERNYAACTLLRN